jgi:hypothetical protein
VPARAPHPPDASPDDGLKTALRIALSLAVAAVLLVIVMVWGEVRPSDVFRALGRLSPATMALAFVIHAAIYALRALRFQVLVAPPHRPPYFRSLVVSAAHNLAAYVLPAKSGEASFIVYLKSAAGVSAARGLASLLVSRLLDLTVLCFGLGLACLWIAGRGGESPNSTDGFAFAGAAMIVSAVVFSVLGARRHLLVALFERVARTVRLERFALGRRVLARTIDVEEALRSAGGGLRLLGATLLSLPLWTLVFAFYAVLARGLGLPPSITFDEAAFGSSIAVLFNLLPVNGLAGFGTQEAGWTFGFGLLGVEPDVAVATGLGAHFVQLFNVCVFGVLAHLVMGGLRAVPAASANADAREEPETPAAG